MESIGAEKRVHQCIHYLALESAAISHIIYFGRYIHTYIGDVEGCEESLLST